MSMDTRMDKYLVVCYHRGRLDGKENEQTNTIGNKVDESHKRNVEGKKPNTRSFMALSVSQGLPPLRWSPLPSFSAAPGCRTVGLPSLSSPRVSLSSTAPLPAGSLDCCRINLYIPSFLESHWPCCHSQPGLHDLSCSSENDFDVEVASGFLLRRQGEFQTYLWDIPSEICLSWCPLKSQFIATFFPPLPFIKMAALVNFQ